MSDKKINENLKKLRQFIKSERKVECMHKKYRAKK